VLILHDEDDTNVPVGQAMYFHRALMQFGAERDLVIWLLTRIRGDGSMRHRLGKPWLEAHQRDADSWPRGPGGCPAPC
jgi:hypothetical protein